MARPLTGLMGIGAPSTYQLRSEPPAERARPREVGPKPRDAPFAFATSYGGHGLRDGDRERPLLVKPYERDGLEKLLRDLLSAPE